MFKTTIEMFKKHSQIEKIQVKKLSESNRTLLPANN